MAEDNNHHKPPKRFGKREKTQAEWRVRARGHIRPNTSRITLACCVRTSTTRLLSVRPSSSLNPSNRTAKAATSRSSVNHVYHAPRIGLMFGFGGSMRAVCELSIRCALRPKRVSLSRFHGSGTIALREGSDRGGFRRRSVGDERCFIRVGVRRLCHVGDAIAFPEVFLGDLLFSIGVTTAL
jgi:hypothetical protein